MKLACRNGFTEGRERQRRERAFSPDLEEDLLLALAENDRGYIVARICF